MASPECQGTNGNDPKALFRGDLRHRGGRSRADDKNANTNGQGNNSVWGGTGNRGQTL